MTICGIICIKTSIKKAVIQNLVTPLTPFCSSPVGNH
jgi:hypothetical protein